MAVQQNRKTRSKRDMRRSHDALNTNTLLSVRLKLTLTFTRSVAGFSVTCASSGIFCHDKCPETVSPWRSPLRASKSRFRGRSNIGRGY